MVTFISQVLNIAPPDRKSRQRTKECLSLRSIAIKAAQKLPKTILNVVYAELNFPKQEKI